MLFITAAETNTGTTGILGGNGGLSGAPTSAINLAIANVQAAAVNDFAGSSTAPTPQSPQPQGSGAFPLQPESPAAGMPSPNPNQGQTVAGVFKPNP
jgi:hypothetical protein